MSGLPVWSVSSLLLAVSDTLAARFAAVAVRGEISGFTRAASGHCYFTLKDATGTGAGLRCAMFRRAAQMLAFVPRDGQQVELRGRLAVYEARGELQMVVEALQQVGAGTLYEEFLRLKARLEAQGLFDPAAKRALPAFPQRIGLVTSAGGAALHDVLTTLRRRAPQVQVVLYPTLVQGVEAPSQIVAALAAANLRAETELILLCRGGGSLEDLWAFNDERVVRAVAGSALPVVCGVGHETDVTLADLAADLRAPTPTAAAELCAPSRDEQWRGLQARAEWLSRRVRQRLEGAAQRLDTLSLRLQQPAHLLKRQSAQLDALERRSRAAVHQALRLAEQGRKHRAERLGRAVQVLLQQQGARLAQRSARLAALDPRQVLSRGYAWVEDDSGRPLVSSRHLRLDQPLRAVWADGAARARVTGLEPAPQAGPAPVPQPAAQAAALPNPLSGTDEQPVPKMPRPRS